MYCNNISGHVLFYRLETIPSLKMNPSLQWFCSKLLEMQDSFLDSTKVSRILTGTGSRTGAHLLDQQCQRKERNPVLVSSDFFGQSAQIWQCRGQCLFSPYFLICHSLEAHTSCQILIGLSTTGNVNLFSASLCQICGLGWFI